MGPFSHLPVLTPWRAARTDGIVNEILRRRLVAKKAGRRGRRLHAQQDSSWPGRLDLALPTEAEVEGHALLLALAHLLDDGAVPEAYVQETVQRRHLTATVPGGAAAGGVVLSREGLALRPS
ncbi:hypothetical protein [Streptomyces sp. NPDC058861]|uniref:hypothetical protein n=1 Tax=Streptomyces sp. NPDC058861 TaxID=3346653 RepID=UPI00367DAB81